MPVEGFGACCLTGSEVHGRSSLKLTIKRIDSISISQIRGIECATFADLEIIPNKPTILVAPNGFGKTSLATAFASLNAKRIDLQKDHCHKGDESREPRLAIEYTLDDKRSVTSIATSNSNHISSVFDVHVINSQLVSKAKTLKFSGKSIATASMGVKPIVLISNIPKKAALRYVYKVAKEAFGRNGKVLPNISSLLERKSVVVAIAEQVDFSKQSQTGALKAIAQFKDSLNDLGGTVSDILASVEPAELAALKNLPHLAAIIQILKAQFLYEQEAAYCLAAIQIADLYASGKAAFKDVAEYYRYLEAKTVYTKLFTALSGTWKNISPREQNGGLVVDFPNANQISNGERDIICFVALLKQARLKFRKQHSILVIDEIFDYLDDANLVACQYYLTQMIAEVKADGRQIFPIVLTHLDPGYFKSYHFSDQKVRYLNKFPNNKKDVEAIIQKRNEITIRDNISKHFLHFHPAGIDLSSEFGALSLPLKLATSMAFANHVKAQLNRYIKGESYDPIATCCAVRLCIEEAVFSKLPETAQPKFLSTHKTVEKLNYAVDSGIAVPEAYYLLGIIYNEALHVRANQDNITPLASKLGNLTIKHIIESSIPI